MYKELKKLNLEFPNDMEFAKAVRNLINHATGDFKTADGYFINPLKDMVYFHSQTSKDKIPSYGFMLWDKDLNKWVSYIGDNSVFLKRENVQEYIKNIK